MQSTLPRAFPWLTWLFFYVGGWWWLVVLSALRREERIIWVGGVLGRKGDEEIVDSE